jgi:hypothetical protein
MLNWLYHSLFLQIFENVAKNKNLEKYKKTNH